MSKRSALGEPATSTTPRGAAHFALPVHQVEPPKAHDAEEARTRTVPAKRAGDGSSVAGAEKQPVTVRLTTEAIARLSYLEGELRRAGTRARQASVSAVLEALIHDATPEKLKNLLMGRSEVER
jgi:hypothetical protein